MPRFTVTLYRDYKIRECRDVEIDATTAKDAESKALDRIDDNPIDAWEEVWAELTQSGSQTCEPAKEI